MDLRIRYGLWTGYGILILDEMDYGLDLDPFGPSAYMPKITNGNRPVSSINSEHTNKYIYTHIYTDLYFNSID